MMHCVQQAVSAVLDADQERVARLVGFADRVRGLHVRRAAVHAALRTLLVLVPLAIVAAWLLPTHRLINATIVVFAALVAATVAGLRARAVADAALLRVRDGSGVAGLDLVGDELATWLEWQPREAGGAMVGWLGRAVEAQLPSLPASALQAVGRRPFGRLLYLLPVALLLLLAWWLLEWFQPPWVGALGGRRQPEPPPAASGPGQNQGSSSPSPSGGDPSASTQKRPDRSSGASPPPPPSPKPEPEPPPKPEPPAPLIDLPGNQHFVLPEHIDDGPTRKMRMHAAELPEPEAGNAAPPPPTATAGTGQVPPPPPPSRETFERAAEQAQRSRHVPAEEQPMVRRFFELLQKAAR